jgi:hypothetical protein
MWNSGCEQAPDYHSGWNNPATGSSALSAVSSIDGWILDGGSDSRGTTSQYKFQEEGMDAMVDLSSIPSQAHNMKDADNKYTTPDDTIVPQTTAAIKREFNLGDAATPADPQFSFLLDYNNSVEGLHVPHVSDPQFRFGDPTSSHVSFGGVVKHEQTRRRAFRGANIYTHKPQRSKGGAVDPTALTTKGSSAWTPAAAWAPGSTYTEATDGQIGKGVKPMDVAIFEEIKQEPNNTAGLTGATDELSCGTRLEAAQDAVEQDMCQLCIRAHHQTAIRKQESTHLTLDSAVRKRRQMKRIRTENKLGCWWKKYGYAGPRYCQRCSELFRDHIIRQYSNSAGCSRRHPCADCIQIIKCFTHPLIKAYQKMDKDRPKQKRRQGADPR